MPRSETVWPNKLREIREKVGDSLVKVVDKMEQFGYSMSAQHLSRLEKGERRLNQENIKYLALALECAPADLLIESELREVPLIGFIEGGDAKVGDYILDGTTYHI